MDAPDIPPGWFRGILDPCLLALVGDGETYGYELAGRLERAGLGRITGGSLYPSLARLEKHGWLESNWRAGDGGPGRKYYRLTSTGRTELRSQARTWSDFAGRVSAVLGVDAAR